MATNPGFQRPDFAQASSAWQRLLRERNLPADSIWIFDENLCFEQDPARAGGFHLGFQTVVTPPPPNAAEIAYDHFAESEARIAFYRIGSCQGKSICLVLCDDWFERKHTADGYLRRDEWGLSFRPGEPGEVEEVKDKQRWQNRILRNRPLHDLDFCMTLRAVHETLAHGRVLTVYERYALKFLHAWHRLLHPS